MSSGISKDVSVGWGRRKTKGGAVNSQKVETSPRTKVGMAIDKMEETQIKINEGVVSNLFTSKGESSSGDFANGKGSMKDGKEMIEFGLNG